jgi:3-oxoacyl-[acyl-carrier protein] reductase
MTYTSTYLSSVFSLKGRSCLLTGGSKGIGRGIAEVLFQAGANVLIVSRNKKDLDACVEGIRRQYAGSEGRIEAEVSLPPSSPSLDFISMT